MYHQTKDDESWHLKSNRNAADEQNVHNHNRNVLDFTPTCWGRTLHDAVLKKKKMKLD